MKAGSGIFTDKDFCRSYNNKEQKERWPTCKPNRYR